MKTLTLTAAQLASVQGAPGEADYFGPYWAKIASKKDRILRLEADMKRVATELTEMEEELADVIEAARAKDKIVETAPRVRVGK